MESLRGQLLVASPGLLDPNFHRTVVLILEHGDEGALGLVLNRPSPAEVADVAPVLADLVEPGDVVHAGGPVEPAAVLVLAELDDPSEATALVFHDVGLLPAEGDPVLWKASARRARVFAGYAGWAAGQLAELGAESWIMEPAERGDVFSLPADERWAAVLRRKGGHYALLSRMPLDPSVN